MSLPLIEAVLLGAVPLENVLDAVYGNNNPPSDEASLD
jgi:hypothetical protein